MEARTVLAVVVLLLLARVAYTSWHHRAVSIALWSAVRWRHLFGAVALFAVVAGVAVGLLLVVPVTRVGLGSLFATGGNAVFAPLEAGLADAAARGPDAGPDWALIAGATAFCGLLAALVPWLAYVEEELFRAGLEHRPRLAVAGASLVFGLVHLVMLVPLAAALAVAVAGGAYATVYRRAHARASTTQVPAIALRAFRPTRRSRAAAARTTALHAVTVPGAAPEPSDAPATSAVDELRPEHAQAVGVFHAAVWHTVFNTLVVTLVWLAAITTAW